MGDWENIQQASDIEKPPLFIWGPDERDVPVAHFPRLVLSALSALKIPAHTQSRSSPSPWRKASPLSRGKRDYTKWRGVFPIVKEKRHSEGLDLSRTGSWGEEGVLSVGQGIFLIVLRGN